jgi:two-component system, OmpR family, response regulator ResD
MENNKFILVVDDELRIQRMLKDFLESNGYNILLASDGQVALDTFFKHINDISLVILDVMMPKKDGYAVLNEIREYSQVPILMLTARSEEYDQINYYSHGADDFLPKPFSPKLLLAHMDAIFKRCYPKENPIITAGVITIIDDKRELYIEDEKLDLSPKEYDLLIYFILNIGLVLTRDIILDSVWGHDYDGDIRTVDTHVKQLRAKLNMYSSYIKTIHGIGYRFEVENV